MFELLDGGEIPGGTGQIDYASAIVKQHFSASSMLCALNVSIRGILRVFNRLSVSIASWLPVPGLDVLVKLVDSVINTSLSHLNQVILAQILRQHADPDGAANPWAIARDSTVLYARNYKGVLRNAAFLTFIIWGLRLVILLLVAAPIAALIGLFHVQAGIWTFALAVVAALSLKAALIDPFATVALIQVFDKLNRRPDSESGVDDQARIDVRQVPRTGTERARDDVDVDTGIRATGDCLMNFVSPVMSVECR